MGIFSSKKKTYVSSVAYNLAGDEEGRTDFLKYTMLNATLQKRPLGQAIIRGYITGQGIKLRHAYITAQRTFSDGLPYSTRGFINNPDLEVLRQVLRSENPGSTVGLLTTVIGSADFTYWVEAWLAKEHGYDHISRTFSRAPAGVEPTALVTYDMQHNGMVNIILTNSDGGTRILQYRLSGVSFLDTYVHCVFKTDTDFTNEDGTTRTVTSAPKYFFYKIGSGTYPTLDASYGTANLGSPYFPCVPIRVNNVDFTAIARRNTQLYKTSEKYLKKVDVDFQKIADSVNDNKDIKEIDYAFIVFGVGLNSKSPSSKQYIWDFVKYLQTQSVYPQSEFTTWENGGNVRRGNPKTNVLKVYHPRLQKDRYNIELQWQYVSTSVRNGVIKPNARIGDGRRSTLRPQPRSL